MTKASFILWGAKGHAKVLASTIFSLGGQVVALVDNDPNIAESSLAVPILAGEAGFRRFVQEFAGGPLKGAVAIGGDRGADRLALLDLMARAGLETPALVDPRAIVEWGVRVAPGSQVLAGAIVGADAAIAPGCIVNHGAVVDHECNLGAGTHVAPNATLCGCVMTGVNVFVGAGATVLPRIQIGDGAIIGSGSVVIRNVRAGTVVKGVPAV